ncbi:hypothetical protein HDU97_004529 [Phlyctochytrium planicorne]|nr:hypothetical protein HDU97_004529 [Phlyctochytrium planicorne]
MSHRKLGRQNLDIAFPEAICQLSGLMVLDLSYGSMYGPLPDSMEKLSQLKVLDLSHNQFSGIVNGNTISKLRDLRYFDLTDNKFEGPLPILQLQNLEYYFIGDNQFTGTIPSEILEFPRVKAINLADNQLVGSWPSTQSDSKLQTLEMLDLRKNYLVGDLGWIANMRSIKSVLLDDNCFSGNPPTVNGTISFSNQATTCPGAIPIPPTSTVIPNPPTIPASSSTIADPTPQPQRVKKILVLTLLLFIFVLLVVGVILLFVVVRQNRRKRLKEEQENSLSRRRLTAAESEDMGTDRSSRLTEGDSLRRDRDLQDPQTQLTNLFSSLPRPSVPPPPPLHIQPPSAAVTNGGLPTPPTAKSATFSFTFGSRPRAASSPKSDVSPRSWRTFFQGKPPAAKGLEPRANSWDMTLQNAYDKAAENSRGNPGYVVDMSGGIPPLDSPMTTDDGMETCPQNRQFGSLNRHPVPIVFGGGAETRQASPTNLVAPVSVMGGGPTGSSPASLNTVLDMGSRSPSTLSQRRGSPRAGTDDLRSMDEDGRRVTFAQDVSMSSTPSPVQSSIERIKGWTADDLSVWLKQKGFDDDLIKVFRDANINGAQFSTVSTDCMKKTLGIESLKVRTAILAALHDELKS